MNAPTKSAPALEPLLKLDDVARLLNCCRRSVESLRASGHFPRPDAMIGRSPRWRVATVNAWIDEGGTA